MLLLPKTLVLVGMMGAGKSAIGRKLAERLEVPFTDSDKEIELAAGFTIPEIYQRYGEAAFRDGEKRVISRILDGPVQILATGGGAFMDAETRRAILARGIAVWLNVELPLLVRRVKRRNNRPLLYNVDIPAKLEELLAIREPYYRQAHITVRCEDAPKETTAQQVLDAVAAFLKERIA